MSISKSARSSGAIEIFLSYAHEDEELKRKLVKHLAILVRDGEIIVWHDRKIQPGEETSNEINAHLKTADIVLLLVSPDYIVSDYLYSMEMASAIERHRAKKAYVIPIILRPCLWDGASFSGLRALPTGGVPCTDGSWKDLDAALLNVAEGLRARIRRLRGEDEPGDSEGSEPERATDLRDRAQEDLLSLLPYLCDRTPQEEDLEEALVASAEPQSDYPMLCIIYGSEEECHDKFRERLQHHTLKNLLKSRLQPLPISDIMLRLPSSDGKRSQASGDEDRNAFFRILKRNLSKELLGKLNASTDELSAAIAQFKNPLIVHSVLSNASWEPDGERVVSWFLEFWNESWVHSTGSNLIICLHIEFDRKREEFLRNEENVRAFLLGLDSTQYNRLRLTTLRELTSIAFLDARVWAGDERNFEGFCKLHAPKFCDVDTVVNEITKLYKQPDFIDLKGRIAMLRLAPELRRMIKTNYCQRNSS